MESRTIPALSSSIRFIPNAKPCAMYKYIHTESVISEVRQRGVLWDPGHALNKDRDARIKAWLEVYEALYPDYNEMEEYKKKELAKLIQQRWKTARDAYMRSKKYQKKGIVKKNYAFSDELRFLDKVDHRTPSEADSSGETPSFVECIYEDSEVAIKMEPPEPEPAQDPFQPELCKTEVQELIQEPFALQPLIQESWNEAEPPTSPPPPKVRRTRVVRKRKLSAGTDFQKEMLGMLRENSELLRNDDLAFCMSLLPMTRDFTVQQKMRFRIEVLKVASVISAANSNGSDSEE